MTRTLVFAGTKKGLFIFESDENRKNWHRTGPLCDAWPVNHAIYDRATKAIYVASNNAWFGPAVFKSTDLGETWSHSNAGLAYPEGEDPVTALWSLAAANGTVYCGVEPAGLFRSDDAGETWSHVKALRDHPTKELWMPGGGGLCLHTIVTHPSDAQKMWIAISAAGAYYTADGGASWEPRNSGVMAAGLPGDEPSYPEVGQCVHHMDLAAGSDEVLYQQNHAGQYTSRDGGKSWTPVGPGLPSTFGFAEAPHPHKQDTFYVIPLNGDILGRYMPDAAAAVWRTTDGGASWQALRNGLPQSEAYFGVLRQGMAVDTHATPGVYFGTSTGHIFASADEGESWTQIAGYLPPIYSVETAVI